MAYKKLQNKGGFTLTEVMIGMMILTVAIVAATNLLISLITSNENNVKSLQAYYFAQEGIELVRNVRDTNWIHNLNWLGASRDQEGLWGAQLNGEITVDLRSEAFRAGGLRDSSINSLSDLKSYSPIALVSTHGKQIMRYEGFFSSEVSGSEGEASGFVRDITINPYTANEFCSSAEPTQCVLVSARVSWKLGSKDHSLTLEEILTNWKGGAL